MPNIFIKSIKIRQALIVSLLFLSLSTSRVSAQSATFSLESTTKLQVNEVFFVQASINTPQASINTVHLAINYSAENLSLEDISFSDSVFSNVVEKDIGVPGAINLTAFTTTPYKGNHGLIATLKFKTIASGDVNISILPSSKIHLADGKGTDVFDYQISQSSLSFIIEQTISPSTSLARVFRPFKKKAEVALRDKEKAETLFPEQNVVDYTKNSQTKIKRFINQLKSTGKTYVILIILLFIIGLAIIFSIATFIYLSKNSKKQTYEA